MFMILKKKHILFAATAIILVIALIFGYCIVDENSNVENIASKEAKKNVDDNSLGEAVYVSTSENLIIRAKNDRDMVRSKAVELLKETLESNKSSVELKGQAEAQILKIAANMDNESKIETVLAAKGYKDCIVFISDDSVTVTIGIDKLLPEDVAKINVAVFEETGNNNIKIVEVK